METVPCKDGHACRARTLAFAARAGARTCHLVISSWICNIFCSRSDLFQSGAVGILPRRKRERAVLIQMARPQGLRNTFSYTRSKLIVVLIFLRSYPILLFFLRSYPNHQLSLPWELDQEMLTVHRSALAL
jgi:hypothetical protein